MTNTSPTSTIAELIQGYTFETLPKDVVHVAKLAILDTLGCAVRGSSETLTKILGEELFNVTVAGKDLIPGQLPGGKPFDLAMLYGASSHAIDYDDAHPEFFGHLGVVVVSAISSLVPFVNISGIQAIAAIVTGYEIGVRINRLLNQQHYIKGFHTTGTVGVLAAAAASGKILNLNTEQTKAALGLAATQAAGIKATFGTMSKPYNAGHAAACGVHSARLAEKGFTAPISALETDKGFLQLYMGLPEDQWHIDGAEEYTIMRNVFKFHAACGAVHPMINAIKQLSSEHNIDPDALEEMVVEAPEVNFKTACINEPQSGLDCKFSYPQVAVSALCGLDTAAEDTYSEQNANDPRLAAMRNKITLVENGSFNPQINRVSIKLQDGTRYRRQFDMRTDLGDFYDQTPALKRKFFANTVSAIGEHWAVKLNEASMSLEQSDSLAASFSA